MNPTPPSHPAPGNLEQLLTRPDIWRGHARGMVPHAVLDTGYPALNAGLVSQGWPVSSLIEVHQQNLSHSEWLLLTPALLATAGGYIVLLNPPALPFCQALIQMGLDLERILVVQTRTKADFLASFFELTRAQACDAVLAWQPQQALSYTELRKCLLATADGSGLYVLFRPASLQRQSSPAVLRLLTEVTATDLQITLFKQRGLLQTWQPRPIHLGLPVLWQGLLPHRLLDQSPLPNMPKPRSATITRLRRGKL